MELQAAAAKESLKKSDYEKHRFRPFAERRPRQPVVRSESRRSASMSHFGGSATTTMGAAPAAGRSCIRDGSR